MTTKPTTALPGIRALMNNGGWWTLWSLRAELEYRFGVYASEAAISARIREIPHERKPWPMRTNASRACMYRMEAPCAPSS